MCLSFINCTILGWVSCIIDDNRTIYVIYILSIVDCISLVWAVLTFRNILTCLVRYTWITWCICLVCIVSVRLICGDVALENWGRIQNSCNLIVERYRHCYIIQRWWLRIIYVFYQLSLNLKLSHLTHNPLNLRNWLEIYEKIISWGQIESCAIECWVYHCEVACLVFSIVLELSMKLRNNKDIAIESIRFNKEHNPAIVCLLN